MAKVVVPIAKGFEEIEAVCMIDIMRRGGIEVIVAALDDKMLVKGANSITLDAEVNIASISSDTIDMIALPGGWGGVHLLAEDANVQRLLKEMDAKNKNIAAICAAPFALKSAGVLKEEYTCYPSVEKEIKQDGYQADRFKVVKSSNVITSRGPGTAICFALAIIKELMGEEIAQNVKEGTLSTFCDE